MKPLYKILLFAIYPLIYFLLGYLNYSLAGKFLLMGVLFVGTFIYLYYYKPNLASKTLAILAIFIMLLHIGYRAILNDVFHMNQDAVVVIESIFSTNLQESLEFFRQYSNYIIKHIIIFILFVSSYIYIIFGVKNRGRVTLKAFLIVASLFLIIHLNPIRRSNPLYFYPYYYSKWQEGLRVVKELKEHINSIIESKKNSVKYIGKEQKRVVVFIIGESSTRANWSLYGYKRDTTPKLNSIKDELLVVNNATAAGAITIPSVERMLTAATKKRPNLWRDSPSILQYAKMAGYKTYWITNHTTDKNGILRALASSANSFIITNKGSSRGEGSFDKALLKPFKEALEDSANKKLIVVHMLGSHPAYNFRYPKEFSKFTYNFDDKVMQDLKAKGIAKWALVFRNLYDNSIFYSDYIRYNLINILKQSKDANSSMLLYISDHGEDVCHHNNFSGHNPKAKEQWMVPMVLWPKSKAKEFIDANISFDAQDLDKLLLKILKIKI